MDFFFKSRAWQENNLVKEVQFQLMYQNMKIAW